MRHRILTLVWALVLAGCGGIRQAPAPEAPSSAPGHLFIVGGGPRPPELMRQFVRLAGGPGRARILVFPMASGDSATGPALVREFRGLGAEARSAALTRSQAMADGSGQVLDAVTGVWFAGGDQNRLTAALAGTPVEAAMHRRYRAGAVIGGTSTGAAVMSEIMITGEERRRGGDRPLRDSSQAYVTVDRDNVVTTRGFAFLRGAIVDQHFLRRRRHNRLLSLVLEHPQLVGVGIDEATALVVNPDGRWTVRGASAVVVHDARRARVTARGVLGTSDVRLHVLPPGSSYDPRTGAAFLPAAN